MASGSVRPPPCWRCPANQGDTIPLDATRRAIPRMIWTIAATVAAIYVGLLLLLRLSESRLIYFPGQQRHLLAPPAGLGLPAERVEIPTDDGITLVSWVIPGADSSAGFWLLMCH